MTYARSPDGWQTLLPVWAVLELDRTTSVGPAWRHLPHVAFHYPGDALVSLVIDHPDGDAEVAWANRDYGNPSGARRWPIIREDT